MGAKGVDTWVHGWWWVLMGPPPGPMCDNTGAMGLDTWVHGWSQVLMGGHLGPWVITWVQLLQDNPEKLRKNV